MTLVIIHDLGCDWECDGEALLEGARYRAKQARKDWNKEVRHTEPCQMNIQVAFGEYRKALTEVARCQELLRVAKTQ